MQVLTSLMANEFVHNFIDSFNRTFIEEDRYKVFLNGFKNTIIITILAGIIGVTIGVIVAILKVSCYQSVDDARGTKRFLIKLVNFILDVYLTVIRGTPVLVQLLILYFVVFITMENGLFVAIIAFGLNSGAYVAEIVRGGIMGVDKGQMEAGRSLGLTTASTMRMIILPQAIKSILPALGNEFITLLKETSVVGYIAIIDMTQAAFKVMGRTYDGMFPLLSIAVVYLFLVVGMTALLRKFERRLARSDRR